MPVPISRLFTARGRARFEGPAEIVAIPRTLFESIRTRESKTNRDGPRCFYVEQARLRFWRACVILPKDLLLIVKEEMRGGVMGKEDDSTKQLRIAYQGTLKECSGCHSAGRETGKKIGGRTQLACSASGSCRYLKRKISYIRKRFG